MEDALFDLSNTQICLLPVRIDAGQKLFGDFFFFLLRGGVKQNRRRKEFLFEFLAGN